MGALWHCFTHIIFIFHDYTHVSLYHIPLISHSYTINIPLITKPWFTRAWSKTLPTLELRNAALGEAQMDDEPHSKRARVGWATGGGHRPSGSAGKKGERTRFDAVVQCWEVIPSVEIRISFWPTNRAIFWGLNILNSFCNYKTNISKYDPILYLLRDIVRKVFGIHYLD